MIVRCPYCQHANDMQYAGYWGRFCAECGNALHTDSQHGQIVDGYRAQQRQEVDGYFSRPACQYEDEYFRV